MPNFIVQRRIYGWQSLLVRNAKNKTEALKLADDWCELHDGAAEEQVEGVDWGIQRYGKGRIVEED
jgi:hypothetical protein